MSGFGAESASASFTIGAEASHVRRVTVQMKDGNGQASTQRSSGRCYLTTSATTLAPTTDGDTLATGTKGAFHSTDGGGGDFVTDASGVLELDITEASAATYYLVVELPNGEVSVSGAITFAG